MSAARQWVEGDRQPRNDDVRQVRGVSGVVWSRSEPAGLFWFPREGGLIASWDELLRIDGPVTADRSALPLALFDLPEAS
ncbi:hypothetical protein [Amycolatopsis vancoresmycina]|uniref:Uncharacterized protein n=1 Tax=Amycolatopsis vancoresmycina DSM 44592 TaxID=1292037 RepID=R1G5Z4_9PSEU|nr:hypothetical protein [Amycolatopsis vancoresmycina]EOD66868.1 hypothetical protein H480_19133 [Amycolatopsis vancoresmycina DSM 44592]